MSPSSNPLPQWVGVAERLALELGSHPLSPGTCCPAPSTLLATQALILLQPQHEQFRACAAPAAWPGPQGPSLVLGCIGKQKHPPWGCGRVGQVIRQVLPAPGRAWTPLAPQGVGTSCWQGHSARADAGGNGEPPGTAWQERLSPEIGLEPTALSVLPPGGWDRAACLGDTAGHRQWQEILPPPQFPSTAGER